MIRGSALRPRPCVQGGSRGAEPPQTLAPCAPHPGPWGGGAPRADGGSGWHWGVGERDRRDVPGDLCPGVEVEGPHGAQHLDAPHVLRGGRDTVGAAPSGHHHQPRAGNGEERRSQASVRRAPSTPAPATTRHPLAPHPKMPQSTPSPHAEARQTHLRATACDALVGADCCWVPRLVPRPRKPPRPGSHPVPGRFGRPRRPSRAAPDDAGSNGAGLPVTGQSGRRLRVPGVAAQDTLQAGPSPRPLGRGHSRARHRGLGRRRPQGSARGGPGMRPQSCPGGGACPGAAGAGGHGGPEPRALPAAVGRSGETR